MYKRQLYVNGGLVSYTPLCDADAIAICKAAETIGFPVAISLEDSCVRVTKDDRFLKQCPSSKGFMELVIQPDLRYDTLRHIRRLMIAMRPNEEYLLPMIAKIGMMRYDDTFVIVEPDDKYKGRCV